MQLSSCYFCGTALDAPVEEYRVVPDDLAPDDGRTVTLCPTCRRKLATVVGAVVEDTDTPGATTLSDFEGGPTDDGGDGVKPLYDPDASMPETADAGRAADEDSPVASPEPGDERSDGSDAPGDDGHDPSATEATGEADTSSGAAESDGVSDTREGSEAASPAPEGDDASDETGGDAATGDGAKATGETADPAEGTGDEADSAVGPAGDATDPADSTGEQADTESGPTGGATDSPGGAVNGDGERAETAGSARSSDTDSGGHPDSDEGTSDATGGAATGSDETDGSDPDERATADTDGESGAGEAGAGEQPQVLSTPAAKKVIRLLQNREFPVDREEFQVVAANAYDLSNQDCAAVVDALVEGGYVAEESGTLVRPEE